MNTNTKRICLHCGHPISGRSDKKFCSDQCRFFHYNDTRHKKEKHIIEVNTALRRNRTILKTLCPEGKATVRKDVLVHMGYDFSHFTSLLPTSKGTVYYICYEYGFCPIIEGTIEKALIINRKNRNDFLDPWRGPSKKKEEYDIAKYFT